MLRIALLGYGKMGRAIEAEALARGHEIAARIDRDNRAELLRLSPETADVVIEFTHPDAFFDNLNDTLSLGLPLVSGTTGWYAHLDLVRQQVQAHAGTLVYSSNFSPGVNLLFRLNRELAALMAGYPEYDCFIEERHHRHKADAPSGTAVSLARQIVERLPHKTRMADEALRSRPPEADELSVGYVRAGETIGLHRVVYTSAIDRISIEHEAHSRQGFALGAVIAAEKAPGLRGCYEFSDIL